MRRTILVIMLIRNGGFIIVKSGHRYLKKDLDAE